MNPLTELRNPDTAGLDTLDTAGIVRLINEEDKKVAFAVEKELPNVVAAVETICASLSAGGRLVYVGAGTSGRLGVIDAAECGPTFGVSEEMVQAVIAGGPGAFATADESREDDAGAGARDMARLGISSADVVVGISASGSTPYTVAALREAGRLGAKTVAVCCVPGSPLAGCAHVAICPAVGPEVLAGSTRMKAGTAQKMVLNMLSTASMIRLGKAYQNLMVDLRPTNAKLWNRATSIVSEAAGISMGSAEEYLKRASGEAKVAIVMALTGLDPDSARARLRQHKGFVRKALGR